jgi:hypothetical protein
MTVSRTTYVASPGSRDAIAAWLLPALTLAFQLATYAGYGYFRDELYYLANGEHLGFGYVEHPPLIGLVAALVRATLGDSLFAIRLLPAFAAAATAFLAGAIARELGGGRFAQVLAGLSAMLAPAMLGVFGLFTMNAFDMLAWAVSGGWSHGTCEPGRNASGSPSGSSPASASRTRSVCSSSAMPAYPVLFAAGGVALERWQSGRVGTLVSAAVVVFLVGGGVALAPSAKAILPVDTFVRYAHALGLQPPQGERQTLGRLPQHFTDMHGWPELVEAVASVYRSLPPADQARACIFARNYGQAGAIDLFGPRYGLPKAIARHNSYFLWGPRGCTGEVVIVIGGRRDDEVLSSFASVDLGVTFTYADCMPYENNKPIWIARGLKQPMSVVWPRIKRYI